MYYKLMKNSYEKEKKIQSIIKSPKTCDIVCLN